MKAPPSRSGQCAALFTDDPREAVALMRDAATERKLAELRENRRAKGLAVEPVDEQIMQIWFSPEHAKATVENANFC
jgi:hypothetical protein